MSHGFARIAAMSLPVHLGTIAANEKQILAAMNALAPQGVELAVFPELCLTGYTLGDLLSHRLVLESALDALLRLAQQSGSMAAVVGLPLEAGGRLYNCAAVLQNGKIQGIVPKTYLSNGHDGEDVRFFVSGAEACGTATVHGEDIPFAPHLLFDTGRFSFAVEIGGDAWAPLPPSSRYALMGAEIIACPAAISAAAGQQDCLRQLLLGQSERLLAGYAYAGAGFGESTADLVFDGYTGIFDSGCVLSQGERFQHSGGQSLADVDIARLRFQRRNRGGFAPPAGERRPMERIALESAKAPSLPLLRALSPLPFVPSGAGAEQALEDMVNIQSTGLKTRLRAIHCQDLVIGVSGGVDSTLALLVAVKAFDELGYPRQRIHGITLPGMGTGARTKTNADLLMAALQISAQEISIEKAVKQHFLDIGQDADNHDVTYENSQARERTQILMDYANKVGGIVLGTGDMSESALGFCTYNGDHMSMYNVNASVPKTLAKRLIRHLCETCFEGVAKPVCADILNTPISPELLPVSEGELAQRTEEILGDYALHDFFLYHLLDSGSDPQRLRLLAAQAFQGLYGEEKISAQLATFLKRFFTQQFKRNCVPDGPKVGRLGLSPRGDWRMPSDMGYDLWK